MPQMFPMPIMVLMSIMSVLLLLSMIRLFFNTNHILSLSKVQVKASSSVSLMQYW